MNVEGLISCMHQSDWSIVKRSNIQTDVLIINQCDIDSTEEYTFANQNGATCHARMICTTQRGLSRSRNIALQHAKGEICIFCDDNEVFENNYKMAILNAFKTNLEYALIALRLCLLRCQLQGRSNSIETQTYPPMIQITDYQRIVTR